MEWFRLLKKAAAKPPAYLIERISDLKHACDVAKTSPREANNILSEVSASLQKQHDEEFVAPLKEASKIMFDSPPRAINAIEKIISSMMLEKELLEAEKEKPKWKK
jgi:hypothetical protein